LNEGGGIDAPACRTDDGSMSTKNLVEFLPPLSEIRGGV